MPIIESSTRIANEQCANYGRAAFLGQIGSMLLLPITVRFRAHPLFSFGFLGLPRYAIVCWGFFV